MNASSVPPQPQTEKNKELETRNNRDAEPFLRVPVLFIGGKCLSVFHMAHESDETMTGSWTTTLGPRGEPLVLTSLSTNLSFLLLQHRDFRALRRPPPLAELVEDVTAGA